jgi:hypothetical protein
MPRRLRRGGCAAQRGGFISFGKIWDTIKGVGGTAIDAAKNLAPLVGPALAIAAATKAKGGARRRKRRVSKFAVAQMGGAMVGSKVALVKSR